MAPKTEGIYAALGRIRQCLADVLRPGSDVRTAVAEILVQLEQIEAGLRQDAADQAGTMRVQRPRGGMAINGYTVAEAAQGGVLIERRRESNPFRCTEMVYNATAAVLAEATHPLPFDELRDLVRRRLKEEFADYTIRVALRFWTQAPQRLVARVRSRYAAPNPRRFAAAARTAWAELAKRNTPKR